jgi:HD-like signal output (HDOD) protein
MSTEILEKLFARMQNSKGLPALESTITSILGDLNDSKKGSRDLVAHITGDFALTQKVLKLVNSPMYAPFAQNTATVSSALSIVGADALLHIVLSTAMISAADLEDDESLSKTLLASEVARNVSSDRQEEVSIAALMYDLGNLIATKFLPEEMALINQKIASGAHSDTAAKTVLGMTLQEVGAEVAKRWKLPMSIVSIIDGTGDKSLVDIAKFSSSVSSLIHEGKVAEIDSLVSTLGTAVKDKSKLTALISRKLEEVTPPASRKLVQADSPEAILGDLFAALTEVKKKTIEELASAIFPELSKTLNTAHCLLFMLTHSGDYNIRYGFGKGIDELKSKLRISAEFKPTVFHAAIKNNVDVSIADVTKQKDAALPDGYHRLLPHVNRFIVLPIANGSVSGLIYCDWENEKELSPLELAAVRKLRDLFLPFIPH